MGKQVIDLLGEVCGLLTVVAFDGLREDYPGSPHRRARWLCRCQCGNELLAWSHNLIHGRTTSCGCYRIKLLNSGDLRRTHGETRSPEYISWTAMRHRCDKKYSSSYPRYG